MYLIDKERIYWRKVEGETVLLNMDSGHYYSLNDVGSLVWEMISEGYDVEEVVLKLQKEYEIDPGVLTKDVKSILKRLEKEGLVTAEQIKK